MLGKLKLDSSSNSEEIRHYLLFKSAGFRILVEKFRSNHKIEIKKIGKKRFFDLVDLGVYSEIDNEISEISSYLGISRYFFENAVLGVKLTEALLHGYSLPIFIFSRTQFPNDGFFIKIDPQTRKKAVLEAFNRIKVGYKKLKTDYPNVGIGDIKNKAFPKSSLDKAVKIFEVVEKVVYDRSDYKDPTGEKLNSTLDPAFEFAAEEIYRKNTPETFKKTKNQYYGILDYYTIPTISEFRKLSDRVL